MQEVASAFFIGSADHRATFLAQAILIVAAGIPLAFAWARLLPEEPPPFKVEPGSSSSGKLESQPDIPRKPNRDLILIVLLLCVTVTYLLRFPGISVAALVQWLNVTFSGSTAAWVISGARAVLLIGTGFAACYAVLRPGPLRVPLVLAAGLVLILWLLGPILQAALLSG
jgi:hypothetical protein